MAKQLDKQLYVAGIIERQDNHLLISCNSDDDSATRLWQFPRGQACPKESPELAMRRIAMDQLGLDIDIVVGQPPIVEKINGVRVEVRYFFCGVIDGELCSDNGTIHRWVPKIHLCEYDFDTASAPVASWLLGA